MVERQQTQSIKSTKTVRRDIQWTCLVATYSACSSGRSEGAGEHGKGRSDSESSNSWPCGDPGETSACQQTDISTPAIHYFPVQFVSQFFGRFTWRRPGLTDRLSLPGPARPGPARPSTATIPSYFWIIHRTQITLFCLEITCVTRCPPVRCVLLNFSEAPAGTDSGRYV